MPPHTGVATRAPHAWVARSSQPAEVAAAAEKRVALVVGNDRYANLDPLQKAANDAQSVGDALARLMQ